MRQPEIEFRNGEATDSKSVVARTLQCALEAVPKQLPVLQVRLRFHGNTRKRHPG